MRHSRILSAWNVAAAARLTRTYRHLTRAERAALFAATVTEFNRRRVSAEIPWEQVPTIDPAHEVFLAVAAETAATR